MTNYELLVDFIRSYPAQPATAYWRAIEIGALLRHGLPDGLGLDLGCGDGILTGIVLEHGGARDLIGIDPDPLEVDAARAFPFYKRLHVAPGDAIPEDSASVDFVLSNSVLEHIPDLEGTIREAARLLRSGGRFVFTVPAPPFRDNLRGPLLPHVERADYLKRLDKRIAHLNYLSRANWTALLTRHGLELQDTLGYMDAAQTRRWESLSRMTGGLVYSIFGEARRPIELQRAMGIRELQNRRRLPLPLSKLIAHIVNAGADVDAHASDWLSEAQASCLLVTGHKP